ncbi:hypothetical protein Tco_0109048 [Tanacetum coccineum]
MQSFGLSRMSHQRKATLQVAYDVLKLTPFYKAFQVSADVPEIYMQEFWASAYVHNRSFRFKMNNKKHILDLDQFRDILQICPKVVFVFSSQNLLGRYIKKKVDVLLYFMCGDFFHQIENKKYEEGKKRCISSDRPKFTTINVISRNEDTRLYGTILPVVINPNEDIRNFVSYKEYYDIASRNNSPKTKGSKKKADTDITTKQKPPTVPKEKKEKKSGKGKQKAKELETIFEMKELVCHQGFPFTMITDADDVISWKASSEVDQADDKNDDDENAQDDANDDKNDDDENVQDDDDEARLNLKMMADDSFIQSSPTHDDETTT